MYCLIKYNDLEASEEDKILYINPDCSIKILLDFIREELAIDNEIEFDLCCDEGVLIFANDYEPDMRASQILIHLGVYYVIIIEKGEEGQFINLTPLLSLNSAKQADITTKIKRYINPTKRFMYEINKPRKSDKSDSGKSLQIQ